MMTDAMNAILSQFAFRGVFQSAKELTSGNINTTYHLVYDDQGTQRHYVLQRINSYVFKNPQGVMSNIARVTEHMRNSLLRSQQNPERRVLEIIRTVDDQLMYVENDNFWRAYVFITDATAYDTVDSPALFCEIGRAFGNFQKLLYDFPADELFESIPDFHNTAKRFITFEASVKKDAANRAAEVKEEIDFLYARRDMMSSIVRLIDEGKMPLRVTHNDTKSNNIMVDKATGKGLCVIDLDTVMPGSALYDYGDAIRFGANTAAEDEPDVSKISLDLDKTYAFTKGFIEETNGFLTDEELHLLPLGVKVLTCELAMRFLTDYLDGDLYFKINSPQHNLVRTRAQIALLKDIERKETQLQEMVDQLIANK
ncbi:MAG: aminoglycoside phosphotransferase family protein [Clostridia bacterium]|nr:aminoglycoside phosphotransferase family protein [Clostridia bacterium]